MMRSLDQHAEERLKMRPLSEVARLLRTDEKTLSAALAWDGVTTKSARTSVSFADAAIFRLHRSLTKSLIQQNINP